MDNFRDEAPYEQQGLYSPRFEHDDCGIGAVVNIGGEQSRYVVENALTIVEKLEHRAGKDAEGKSINQLNISFIRIEAVVEVVLCLQKMIIQNIQLQMLIGGE